MPYQQTLEELPTYTVAQLTELRKRCALLLQQKASVGSAVEESDWLLEGVLAHCRDTGLYVSRSFHLKRSGSFAGFATKSDTVRELLLECAPGLSPVQRIALGRVCARELANYLHQPSFNMMMQRVDWVPNALNKAFPGYMQSKLLQLVVPYDGE